MSIDGVRLMARPRGRCTGHAPATPTPHQQGFTLIELLVVILIIGILSAIALPAFLGQRAKAQDSAAKSNARTVVSAMEACYTEVDRYDPCPDGAHRRRRRHRARAGRGHPERRQYAIVAHSVTGNTFTVRRTPTPRSCTATCRTPHGGCPGGAAARLRRPRSDVTRRPDAADERGFTLIEVDRRRHGSSSSASWAC